MHTPHLQGQINTHRVVSVGVCVHSVRIYASTSTLTCVLCVHMAR